MTNQEMKLQKMERSCDVTKRVLAIFRIIFIVFAALFFIVGGVLFGMQKTLDPIIEEAVENETVTFHFTELEIGGTLTFTASFEKMLDNGQYSVAFGIFSMIAVVVLVLIIVVMSLFIKIFALIKENGTPFCEEVTEKLKGGFIFTAIVIFFVSGIGTGLVMSLVFWCIYWIFEYGSVLQTESDETL